MALFDRLRQDLVGLGQKRFKLKTRPRAAQFASLSSEMALIYLHMAKTGGVTLGETLNKQFPIDKILLPGNIPSESALGVLPTDRVKEKFSSIPVQQWDNVSYMPGHFMFGVHEAVPKKSLYITMLRHPVDRVISSYYYILEQPGIPINKKILEEKLDLEGYIHSGLGLDPHNYQTRVLAGLPQYDADWANTSKVLQHQIPNSVLKLAIDNIENHFCYVGLTERFDEFLLLLKLALNWPLDRLLYKSVNETRRRPKIQDIPRKTIRLIKKHNYLDIKLYEFAQKRFQKSVRQNAQLINWLLPQFKELNLRYQRLDHQNIVALACLRKDAREIEDNLAVRSK